MTTKNSISMDPAISKGVLELTPQAAAAMLGNIHSAKAMVRAVMLAEAALADGSIDWGPANNSPDRWSPVLADVCVKLRDVRDTILETSAFVNIAWPAFVALAEAIEAALWHMSGPTSDALDAIDFVAVLQVLVSQLEAALQVCASEGVHVRATMH